MGIKKNILVDGKEVPFKASAAVPRLYRLKFGRDIYKDFAALQKSVSEGDAENSEVEMAAFALLFEFDGDKKHIRHVMYNCTASRPGIEGKTNEDSKEVKTETLSLTASALVNGLVKSKTSEATVQTAYDNWYKSVYMPFLPTSKATTTTKE